ncbi:thioesterase family protein [Skermanella rosea]|uniref:thioesterase family protein n=1 Tax=Skermanella rosea TaxID=1817965 RepID=UPI001931C094|nr:thioesterase family protein [Skermanella rosea]UEM05389.1 thioesterase family protein [Skermanella rosea]
MTDPLLRLHSETVRPEWIDYNGHMNVAYYVLAFDHATDRLLDHAGLGAAYVKAENRSVFVLEMHVTYEREVRQGDPLAFATRILGVDGKRVHLMHAMHHGTEGWLAATNELVLMHVDLGARRSCPLPDAARLLLDEVRASQSGMPVPPQVGRVIGLGTWKPDRPSG